MEYIQVFFSCIQSYSERCYDELVLMENFSLLPLAQNIMCVCIITIHNFQLLKQHHAFFYLLCINILYIHCETFYYTEQNSYCFFFCQSILRQFVHFRVIFSEFNTAKFFTFVYSLVLKTHTNKTRRIRAGMKKKS